MGGYGRGAGGIEDLSRAELRDLEEISRRRSEVTSGESNSAEEDEDVLSSRLSSK